MSNLDPVETVEADIIQTEPEEVKQGTNYSINAVYSILKKAKSDYEEVIEVGGVPDALVERRLIIRDALLDYYQELRGRDTVWYQKPQPEATHPPKQRPAQRNFRCLRNWPIWIDQELTGERYYRYDFDNGESFVIRVSLCRKYLGWDKGYSKELTYGREEYFILKKDLPFVGEWS